MWDLQIEHIGGIRAGETTINAGSNVIQASNFQGKSSFLAALQTVMGTTGEFEDHPLMEGADEGEVTLEAGDETYHVTLSRSAGPSGDVISREGDIYLTEEKDQIAARLFAFLGENNPVRAAVRNGDTEQLTELLKRPLETEQIESQVKTLERQIINLRDDLKEAEEAANKLPGAQETVTQLEGEIEDLKERKAELEELVDEDDEQEELRDKLSGKRTELDSKERELEKHKKNLDRRKTKRENKKAELENIEIPEEQDLDTGVSEKEDRVEELKVKTDLLGDLYRVNKQVLDEGELSLITDVDRSIAGDTVDCWVCGGDTTKEDVEERLQSLKEKKQSLEEEQDSLKNDIEEIEERRATIRQNRSKKERLEDDIKQLNVDIKDDEANIEELKEQVAELEAEVEELEAQYEETEEEEEEYGSELTNTNTELGRKENELEREREELAELEEKASKRDSLEEQINEKREEKKELNARRESKLNELEDQFNEGMEEIVDKFAPGFEKARLIKKDKGGDSYFDLEVAREVDGKGRVAKLENLSEGERELVGIVAALAGYRTFDVAERVPCILLDSIGQLDADHIHRLIDYLEDTSEILVTTAYPEAGDFEGTVITPDNWDVISNEEEAATA